MEHYQTAMQQDAQYEALSQQVQLLILLLIQLLIPMLIALLNQLCISLVAYNGAPHLAAVVLQAAWYAGQCAGSYMPWKVEMHAFTRALHSLHSMSVEVVLPADCLEKLNMLAVSVPFAFSCPALALCCAVSAAQHAALVKCTQLHVTSTLRWCIQVENMSTTELQQQLQARGINYQGLNKYQLEDTLWRYIQIEAGLLPAEDTVVSLLAALASL